MRRQSGMTLIELMTGLVITGLLLLIAAPAFTTFIQNNQIRTAAESILGGLQLARAEAIKGNTLALFSLTTSIDDGCAVSPAGPDWAVSSSDPTAACGSGAQVIRKQAADGTANAVVAATQNTVAASGQIVFNGFGRVTPVQSYDIDIDVTNPAGGNCGTGASDMRCLRVVVSPAGMIRLCDPSVAYSLSNSQGC
ncbi:MAG TPA: GspH/FimT family pseudopilin [Rhodocyclaceae bacterium]|nr:GspH/FimT family pseudopilin [Rhodocyclaceae bacterium]